MARKEREKTAQARCRIAAALTALVGVLGLLPAKPAWALGGTAESGLVYESWRGSRGEKGTQLHLPVVLRGSQGNFSAAFLTAYAHTSQTDSGGESASVGGLVDTKVGASYRIADTLPVDLLVGLDLNLPTGKTNLSQKEAGLDLDSERMTVTELGEGFNVNPTLSAGRSWGAVAVGVGVGYLWRGTYDRTADEKDYDPGDLVSGTLDLRWAFAPEWETRLLAKYSHYSETRQDGDPAFQEGDFRSLLAGARWDGLAWGMTAALEGIFRAPTDIKDSRLGPTGDVDQGQEYRATVSVRRVLASRSEVSAMVRGLLVTDNGESDTSPRQTGSRRKVSLSLGLGHWFTPHLAGHAAIGGFWMHDDAANFPAEQDASTYWGETVAVRLEGRF